MTDNKAYMKQIKDYLKRIKKFDNQIDCLLVDLENVSDLARRITATMKDDVVSGAMPGDKVGNAVTRLFSLNEQINQQIDMFVDLKNEIHDLMGRLEEPEHIKVLDLLYFRYQSWNEIAEAMNMSERNAQLIHGEALLAFGELMNRKE